MGVGKSKEPFVLDHFQRVKKPINSSISGRFPFFRSYGHFLGAAGVSCLHQICVLGVAEKNTEKAGKWKRNVSNKQYFKSNVSCLENVVVPFGAYVVWYLVALVERHMAFKGLRVVFGYTQVYIVRKTGKNQPCFFGCLAPGTTIGLSAGFHRVPP